MSESRPTIFEQGCALFARRRFKEVHAAYDTGRVEATVRREFRKLLNDMGCDAARWGPRL